MAEPATGKTPIDKEEDLARYAAYGARLRTVAMTAKRYLAYSSDFGEAMRPVVPPVVVKAAYGLSWMYVTYDVAMEGKRAQEEGAAKEEVARRVGQRAVFQGLASMFLPALTIHTQVRFASDVCRKLGRFQRWGPTLSGFALMPLLPYMFDEPVEHGVEFIFNKLFPTAKKTD